MSIKVDSHIAEAISKFINEQGMTQSRLAEKLGVTNASLTKWRRVGNGITSQKWLKLFPLIEKYLPKERFYTDDAGKRQYSSTVETASGYYFESKYTPMMVPLANPEQLEKLNTKIESVTQFGQRMSLPTVECRPKFRGQTEILAVSIEGNEYSPILPAGTTLFICTTLLPQNEGLVVAKPTSGKSVFVGRFIWAKEGRGKPSVRLISVNGHDTLMTLAEDKVDESLSWIFPVVHYEVITYQQ